MALGPVPPLMTPEEFRQVREALVAYAGLSFKDDLRYLLERRLASRLEALGLGDYGAYAKLLQSGAAGRAELALAAELLLTHETYFFREMDQLQSFVDELLPVLEAERASRRRLRIWSAGCSTGEEPYTLAMLLLESGRFTGWDVSVLGTDLSRKALEKAKAAEYPLSALRSTPADLSAKYFTHAAPGRYRVVDPVRAMVQFGQVNLLDEQNLSLVGPADVIFCRNVMIYFAPEARKRALQVLHRKLGEGGFLLLGHSENLINVTADFELVQLKRDLVYRRPRGS
jgi:chemotaxis protein methyltransferase CheR